ncbi:Dehydrogenase/reductase SDR family member 13 [Achaetomium macrosporum]|uniref:Dehydrogenase/reductase SDR family member 13 n=1 Tax=Achaetomium macrosporum TaxID=79813 RepID=A0AAN7HAS2_9PEZI|nr:Dehydrogenase/reductase SDR family member 13 [Achaetomium macrosporum]
MSSDNALPAQKRNLPLLATRDNIEGRTYIVTGANTGLGFEAAKHLASLGAAKVILAVRNTITGQAAKQEIDTAAGTTDKDVVEVWPLDLCSYDSVKAFAKRAKTELERIDGLIENAGLAQARREMAEGHTVQVTVNVLSTFLLAVLLLPVMSRKGKKFGTQSRLTIVTSSMGFTVKDQWEKINRDPLTGMDDEALHFMQTYSLTKLVENLAVHHLARELWPVEKTGVIINTVCPGLCVTKLGRDSPPDVMANLRHLHALFGRSAEDGSRTLLHGVVGGIETHGKYLDSCEIAEDTVMPDWAKDPNMQKQAWDVITKELDAVEIGCVAKMLECAA